MKKLMVGNWKSNKTLEEAKKWMDTFQQETVMKAAVGGLSYTTIICPPMPLVMYVSNRLLDRSHFQDVVLGIQDLSPYPAGSYTGAVSTRNLEGFDVRYAILGHSERRRYFGETPQDVAKKAEQAIGASITPIICVDKEEIESQAAVLSAEVVKKSIFAYEPHQYIGTGKIQPVPEILEQVQTIKEAFGDRPVLYGASVNPETIEELQAHEIIAGFLVGSASLEAEQFAQMVK